MPLGITLIHAQQIGAEERCLVAAGAGADFQDDVPLVVWVLWQQQPPQRFLLCGGKPLLLGQFRMDEFLHLRFQMFRKHIPALGDGSERGFIGMVRCDNLFQGGMFAHQLPP